MVKKIVINMNTKKPNNFSQLQQGTSLPDPQKKYFTSKKSIISLKFFQRIDSLF